MGSAGLGVTLIGTGLLWLLTLVSGWAWPWKVVPAAVFIVVGVLIVRADRPSAQEGAGMSSFIKMGKGARLKDSNISRNRSDADNFIEMGDDGTIEDTMIEDNVHEPGEQAG